MKLLAAPALVAVLLLGQAAPTPVTTTTLVEWDHDGLDVQGQAEQLQGFELALTPTNIDLRSTPPAQQVFTARTTVIGPATRQASMSALLTGVPAATYRLWVRAVDQAGNVSAWAAPVDVTADLVAPSIPANIKITIAITFN